jgi:hypothetical protein
MSGVNASVSKTVSTPSTTASIRSSPMPVSMFLFGRSTIEPSASRLYCMNTRFQNST